jgi:rod shape determining protein RodA
MTALRAGTADFDRRDEGPLWIRIDVSVILLSIGLLAIGLVVVYSATRGVLRDGDIADRSFLDRQIIFIVVGLVAGGVTAAVDYRKARALVPAIYAVTTLLLVAVLLFGTERNGARSWFSTGFADFQPSEFAKPVMILALAAWFSTVQSRERLEFVNVMIGLAIAGLLAGLVLLQPDFGTVMVYGAVVAGIVIVAGVAVRHVFAVLALLVVGVWAMVAGGVLRQTQLNRFTAFADPESVSRYNVNQAEIAIGNGGMTGTGLFQGSQNNSSLVPEKETDFIFSVVGEELGFVGGAVLLVLFGLLLMRIWRIAHLAENDFGRLIAVGVFCMFLFQAFQSVGMNMGMMPVTGIPLPLISAGGSSMITNLICLGLVQNVHAHRLR